MLKIKVLKTLLMCKDTSKKPNSKERKLFSLPEIVSGKEIRVDFNAPDISSNGGLLLAGGMKNTLAWKIGSLIPDSRKREFVHHTYMEMVCQRVGQILCGYEDANDCDRLRGDSALKMSCGRKPSDEALCSQPTMTRLENNVGSRTLYKIGKLFLDEYISSFDKAPKKVVIDADDTNANTYGGQQLTLFNAYYNEYCYMPLMLFDGLTGKLMLPLLRPGRRNKSQNVARIMARVVEYLHGRWPKTVIELRGDSHFCSHEFMDWASDPGHRRVLFITGLSANNRLLSENVTKELLTEAWHDYNLYGMPVRKYGHFYYKAGSWLFPQKVVVKAEITAKGEQNVRFIVSNIRSVDDCGLYETTYCGRGKDELYIRQFKEAVNGDRLSCHTFNANRLRIFIHAAAYILLHSIRERALRGTELENANLLTIRERLLLTAVCVRASRRKVILDYPRHNPMRIVLRQALLFYGQLRA